MRLEHLLSGEQACQGRPRWGESNVAVLLPLYEIMIESTRTVRVLSCCCHDSLLHSGLTEPGISSAAERPRKREAAVQLRYLQLEKEIIDMLGTQN